MKTTATPTEYSPFKSHNRELRSMSWDECWETFTRLDGLAARYVAQYRESRGVRGYHANSRTVVCQKAFELGLRRRMRELDRDATGDTDFCDKLFAS